MIQLAMIAAANVCSLFLSSSVMDCHATVQGSISGGNGVFTELHILHKGQ